MDNIKGPIITFGYLYVRGMVFSYHGVWLRSVVPKINPKQVLRYACKAPYMFKNTSSFFGKIDNGTGSVSS